MHHTGFATRHECTNTTITEQLQHSFKTDHSSQSAVHCVQRVPYCVCPIYFSHFSYSLSSLFSDCLRNVLRHIVPCSPVSFFLYFLLESSIQCFRCEDFVRAVSLSAWPDLQYSIIAVLSTQSTRPIKLPTLDTRPEYPDLAPSLLSRL